MTFGFDFPNNAVEPGPGFQRQRPCLHLNSDTLFLSVSTFGALEVLQKGSAGSEYQLSAFRNGLLNNRMATT